MVKLFTKEYGLSNDQTIIFLHASGSSSRMWRHHVKALKEDFHCITVDLPGHGNSRNVEWTTFDEVIEQLIELIRDKAHGKPHLVGLSLGGSLILKLLEREVHLVDRVIVDGASPQPIKGYRKVIALTYFLSFLKNTKLIAGLMTKMMQEDGVAEEDCRTFIADLQRTSRKSFRRAMSQANRLKIEGKFDNPAFFLSGGKESETMQESHRLLAQRNHQSEVAIYPDKGHAWLFSDVETHIQLLKHFLQGVAFPEKLRGI